MIPKKDWKWFGTPGHFICADRCLFHMCTQVGKVLVSSVGMFRVKPDDDDFEEVGCGRKFETMVFRVGDDVCSVDGCGCGMPIPESWSEIQMVPANTAGEAQNNHMLTCMRWAKEQ